MGAATANGTKPKRETWVDWLPPGAPEPAVLSRDELLAHLRSWRIDVTERNLRFWEYEGVLPRSVRRGHTGAVRAVYPSWYPYLVRQVRRLQDMGFSLDQVRRRVRAFARFQLGLFADPDDPLDDEIRAHAMGPGIEGPEDVRLPDAVVGGLERVARWHERITGVPTDHTQVWIVDAEGNATHYPWPVADGVRFVPSGPPRLTPIDENQESVVR